MRNLQFLLAHNIFPINCNLIEIRKLAHREPDSCYQFLLWPLSLLPTSQSKISELEEEDIMENENPSDNSHNSHGDEFNRSIPTNIQWMPQFQFQRSLFPPFNPSLFYQQQRIIQQSQLSSDTHHTLPENMIYGSQDSHGSPHQGHFHSQPPQDQRPSQTSEQNSTIARGINWSILEDTRLCDAWVRVSTDPITGSDQKRQGFWARVHADFAKQHGQDEFVTRNQRACDL
ncbi:hypothetical protein Drorol1_Dr00020670 [Drosera rotundifolia]